LPKDYKTLICNEINAISSRFNQSRKYLPVGLGVSFIIVCLTCCGLKSYLSRNENLDWPLVLARSLCRLLTALVTAFVYSRTLKLVCGTIKPTVSEVLLLPLIGSWIGALTPPLVETTSAPTVKRMHKTYIFLFFRVTNLVLPSSLQFLLLLILKDFDCFDFDLTKLGNKKYFIDTHIYR